MSERNGVIARIGPSAEPPGVECPGCGSTRSRVVRTRPGSNCVRRWRRCGGCEQVYRTVERLEADGHPDRDAA